MYTHTHTHSLHVSLQCTHTHLHYMGQLNFTIKTVESCYDLSEVKSSYVSKQSSHFCKLNGGFKIARVTAVWFESPSLHTNLPTVTATARET